MAVTFDSIELIKPKLFDTGSNVIANSTTLLSGKRSVQSTTETAISVKFNCFTEDHTDIANIMAKIGSVAVLSIDGDTYNCYINSFKQKEVFINQWEYEVGFLEDTT